MKIKYNVLWVENEQDWLDSIVDEIQEFVEELGFKFSYDVATGRSDISDYNKYDLILMDLNLASEPTGDEIIQEIRNLNIYTDVVFYSASGISAIRAKGNEKELEGVYYSGRNNVLFLAKVQGVIMTTIRKTQDLTNLRGLVMAEVSELDVMMGEILLRFLTLPKNLEEFLRKVTADREKSIRKSLNKPDGCNKNCNLLIRQATIEDIVAQSDASQKARGVNLVLTTLAQDGTNIYVSPNGKGFMENYETDIIRMRNNMAHCQSIEMEADGREILKTRRGDVVFNSEDFIKIRKNIVAYHTLFDILLEKLAAN